MNQLILKFLIIRRILFVLFVLPLMVVAQEKGIQFEYNTNWEKLKEKAKAENKHIFVDCFTTWCGPCTWMAENVFVKEEVGEFFNANYVNLKLQFDETENDPEDVKSWYDQAKRFAKDYGVRAYPTFLVFDPMVNWFIKL
ncbi:thioredoxin family protein [Sphingobacterium bovisgrunnientis]|uniref:thioredoxin family protein n=1 Tax=Sphingobacterium bovisgrunnientis TaxID=1874697 RepID=UPI001357DFC7|nr:thioredoxin family protein [Sphingobacterium bovisgrunnientis]